MGDQFDGCECIWSHEIAMQRLINFIRQNQNACTDTECIDVSGRVAQTGQAGADTGDNYTVVVGFMILALFMYILNPSTLRQLTTNNNNNKPIRRDNNQDGSPPPPQPPPSIN